MNNKITSLLIDEKADQRIQFYLSLDLLKVNRACVCQNNIFDALAYLKQQPGFTPDYIFVSSPVHAALFIKQLRKIDRLKAVPVLHFTDPENALSQTALDEAGFTGCLLKQRDIYCLRDALKVVFEKKEEMVTTVTPSPLLDNLDTYIREMLKSSQALLEAPHRLSA